MKHDYRNIISAAAADKQAANDNIVWLEHQVNINLGSVSIDWTLIKYQSNIGVSIDWTIKFNELW